MYSVSCFLSGAFSVHKDKGSFPFCSDSEAVLPVLSELPLPALKIYKQDTVSSATAKAIQTHFQTKDRSLFFSDILILSFFYCYIPILSHPSSKSKCTPPLRGSWGKPFWRPRISYGYSRAPATPVRASPKPFIDFRQSGAMPPDHRKCVEVQEESLRKTFPKRTSPAAMQG